MTENIVQLIRSRNRLVLAVLVAASLISFIAVLVLQRGQEDMATAINMAGRLRYLSQMIAWKSLDLVEIQRQPTSPAEFHTRQRELAVASGLFRSTADGLATLLVGLPLSQDVTNRLAVGGALRNRLLAYADQADILAGLDSSRILPNTPSLRLIQSGAAELLNESDRLVNAVERETRQRANLLLAITVIGEGLEVILIILVGFAVLKPLEKRVEADLDARRANEYAMQMAKREAEAANQAKSMFLANMSHELRTPLNAVIGFADVMRSEIFGPLGSERYREYVQNIFQSGQHLLDLVSDVLDMSKIEAGRLDLALEPAAPGDLIAQARLLLRAPAQAKDILIVVDGRDDLPWIEVDPLRMKQVLLNLIGNAIKFTPRGGRITIRAGLLPDGGMAIAVADTGIGIAATDIPKAFEIFGQIEGAHQESLRGAGLGLPLSRRLVELHGGRLELASDPGLGTTVTIILPPERVSRLAASEMRPSRQA
ncbi:MAG: hypothetical protein HZC25_17540 [Rhodospirillales bacterium]|nr:hypothetical protein [Rhodospirillales bacterium]